MPSGGVGAFSTTVPVDEVPPWSLSGLNCTATGIGGAMMNAAEADRPSDAVTVADAALETAGVVTANVAEDAPALTVTLGGTVMVGALLLEPMTGRLVMAADSATGT